ncbi:MAG TPA: cytochrome c oxidase assembly protein [Candidatus Limnocylindria bacterium]|nr:cytochrome c oxidase assembly protein [Candidatus Limnocylindria bacterium]
MNADVVAVLLALTALYAVGWTRLTRRSPGRLRRWLLGRLAAGIAGIAALAAALLGLHDAAHESFVAHMIQHLLLLVVAAPALLLSDPMAAAAWALPAPLRRRLGSLLAAGTPLRRAWRGLTRMPVAWTAHALALWLWHVPVLYSAALADARVHDLEHLTFFASAVLFWWPVLGRGRWSAAGGSGGRIVYVVLGAFQSAALGLVLLMSPAPLYAYPLDDQARGALVMLGAGGAIDMAAVLFVVYRFLARDDARAVSLTALQR